MKTRTRIATVLLLLCMCVSATAQTKEEAYAYLKALEESGTHVSRGDKLSYHVKTNSFDFTKQMSDAFAYESMYDSKSMLKKTLRNGIITNENWWDAARACIICNKKFIFYYTNKESKKGNGKFSIVFTVEELKQIVEEE